MKEIVVKLNQKSVIQKDLQNEITKFLSSLKSNVNYSKKEIPPEPGTLGDADIIQFIIESGDDVIKFISALFMLYNQIKSANTDPKKKGEEEKSKDASIEIDKKRISLPASEAVQKKFIKDLESTSDSDSKPIATVKKKRPRKTSGKKK